MGTLFTDVYDRFFGKITDDMYLEYTYRDTLKDLRSLIIDAIPGFEFPRKKLDFVLDYEVLNKDEQNISTNHLLNAAVEDGVISIDEEYNDNTQIVDTSHFEMDLTSEEINIIAILMMTGWLQKQITSIENTRMKYSGTDFKMTSQANHLSKLLSLLNECNRQSHHMQRLYKRRKVDDDGYIRSNWSILRENTVLGN